MVQVAAPATLIPGRGRKLAAEAVALQPRGREAGLKRDGGGATTLRGLSRIDLSRYYCLQACMYVCMHVCVHVYMHVCMCTYIYMNTICIGRSVLLSASLLCV